MKRYAELRRCACCSRRLDRSAQSELCSTHFTQARRLLRERFPVGSTINTHDGVRGRVANLAPYQLKVWIKLDSDQSLIELQYEARVSRGAITIARRSAGLPAAAPFGATREFTSGATTSPSAPGQL
jgi:hypothetical protein